MRSFDKTKTKPCEFMLKVDHTKPCEFMLKVDHIAKLRRKKLWQKPKRAVKITKPNQAWTVNVHDLQKKKISWGQTQLM